MDLNAYILEKAQKEGICAPWGEMLKTASKSEMMDMYVRGIDFCIEHDFPSNSDLLNLVGASELSKYGVFVDEQLTDTELIGMPFIVMLGSSRIFSNWIDGQFGQVYVKHTSKATINTTDNAFLIVDAFDNSEVNITASGHSKVMVNLYGNATINQEATQAASIKIINKHKPTY